MQFLTEWRHLVDFESVDTKHAKAFYFPKGSVSILHPCVLHFSPCAVWQSGFKSLIVLPKGTNEPLDENALAIREKSGDSEAKLLFAQNKWLITHKENERMVERGAFVGVRGENLRIHPI